MPKFIFTELVDARYKVVTARLGAGTGPANNLDQYTEVDKFVRQVADSRYDLSPVDSEIEGFITSIESATQDLFTIGSVQQDGRKTVTFEGTTMVIGDYVVAGTPNAKGTIQLTPPRVKKAAVAGAALVHTWRVISGTGVAGTTGLIERV